MLAPRISTLLLCAAVAAAGAPLGACTSVIGPPGATVNRPDGEGFAGRGELVVRIGMPGAVSGINIPGLSDSRPERASIELRYLGLDSSGRAVFERRDSDKLAGAPVPVATAAPGSDSDTGVTAVSKGLPPDSRQIVLDLRLVRQIRIQGKIIEVLEATPSGVVFRVY